MNSERRHELQENILANYMARLNHSIEPYSKPIALGIAALVIAGLGYILYTGKVSGDRSDATFELLKQSSTFDPDDLAGVSAKFPDTPAGEWANLYQGSALLAQGSRNLYANRNDAEDTLLEASKAFRNALADGKNPLLRSRAHFGIARTEETLGNLDKAIDAYKACIAVNESDEMVKACEERIAALSNPDTKEFLAWFKEQDFSPKDPSAPPSLPSGTMLPDLPDLSLPDLGETSDKEPADGLNMPDDKSPEKKAAENSSESEKEKPVTETEETSAKESPVEPSTSQADGEKKSDADAP